MEQHAAGQGYLHSRGYTRYVFTLLFLLYMFDYIDRMVVSALFPYLKADLGLTDTQLGALVSAVYWSIVVLTFPLSIMVDRWSRRRTIGGMAFIWSLATAACAITKTYPQLFLARTFIGVGESGYAPGGSAMISGMYPIEKRSWMMGLWNASIPLGSAIGVGLGGFIAAHWGWRHAFGIVAIPGIIIAILFFFIKDYKTVDLSVDGKAIGRMNERVKMSWRELVREFTTKPSLAMAYFGMIFMVFATTSMLTWLPSYFSRIDEIPEAKASMKASLVMLLALVGAPLGGYLTDLWRKRRINSRLLFPSLAALLSAVLMFLAMVVFHGSLQYITLLAMGIVITSFIPGAGAATQDLVHPGLRAISYSFAVIFQNLLGASLAPIVIGRISDKTDLPFALSLLPIVLIIACILFFIGSLYYKRDLDRVENIPYELEDKHKVKG